MARAKPRVTLLYRPGHYDIMYTRGGGSTTASTSQAPEPAPALGAAAARGGLDDSAVSRSLQATLDAINDGSITADPGARGMA